MAEIYIYCLSADAAEKKKHIHISSVNIWLMYIKTSLCHAGEKSLFSRDGICARFQQHKLFFPVVRFYLGNQAKSTC